MSIELIASPVLQLAVLHGDGRGRMTILRFAGQRVETDRSGRLEYDELQGDELLEIQALGPLGNVLATKRLQLEGAGVYPVEIRLDEGLATFSGRVRDDGGRALVGAAILVTGSGGETWRLRTGREGQFHARHGELGPVRVEISKAGFEKIVLDGVRIAGEQGREFVLRTSERE